MIIDKQPTNEELITAPPDKWKVPIRTNFKLTIQVDQIGVPEHIPMKFQKQCEDIAVKMFKGANIRYILE